MALQTKSGLSILLGLKAQLIVNIIHKRLFLTLSVTQQPQMLSSALTAEQCSR